jgi:hypothetical protein
MADSQNGLVIQNAWKALDMLKYEVASELGITPPTDGNWGAVSSYENGSIGGSITKRLVAFAQEQLAANNDTIRRFKNKKLNPPKIKTSKDGQKERADREVHVGWAGCVKHFQALAILKTIPLDCKNKATCE